MNYKSAPRVGRELTILNTTLYTNKLMNITYGIMGDPTLYSSDDLNKMYWPYGSK